MSKSGNLAALSALFESKELPQVYFAEDEPYLPRILIFYWPVPAIGSFSSASRIRITILSAAGFKSFGAFSVAPSSSYYSAVHKLPDDKQRDEVCRAVAFAMCRYFSDVPIEVKNAINDENVELGVGLKWGQSHAAQVARSMSRVMNVEEVLEALRPFVKQRSPTSSTSSIKPVASIRKTRPSYLPSDATGPTTLAVRSAHATTPSRRVPSGSARSPSLALKTPSHGSNTMKECVEQVEQIRYKMCEIVDTEDNYITRLRQLNDLVTDQGRTARSLTSKISDQRSQRAVNAMLSFPELLDNIKDLNLAFLDDIEQTLRDSELAAVTFIDNAGLVPHVQHAPKDPAGIYAFAKVLLNHFPKFPVPYREYLDLHSQISSNLEQFLKDGSTSVQIAPALLMEPAQRISRYGLYIDTMLPLIPDSMAAAIRTLKQARRIIAEICEMEPAASTILDSLRIDYESKKRTLSPTKLISGFTRSGTVKEAPALTSSLTKEKDSTRLLPSLSRSFSRRHKSRPGLAGILSETDPSNAQDRASPSSPRGTTERNDENRRPWSAGSLSASLRGPIKSRPTTANSGVSAKSGSQHSPPALTEPEHARLRKLEEDNYRLLAENAELKRRIRECRCVQNNVATGGAKG